MYYLPVNNWVIPRLAWSSSFREMAKDGIEGNEGVALWLGKKEKGVALITHVVFLRGANIIKKPDLLIINSDIINEVTDYTILHELVLIGQIHSHGHYYGTSLSHTDQKYGICAPYYLSIVAPDYGTHLNTTIAQCGVHVYESDCCAYRRLSAPEILQRINFIENTVSLITLGDSIV